MGSPRARKEAPSTDTPVSQGPAVTLAEVVEKTKNGQIVYTAPSFHTALIESGDVEVNPEMTDTNGLIATRATQKALAMTTEAANETTQAAEGAQAAATPVAPKFEIESGIAIPDRKPRSSTGLNAGRKPIYPFDALEINQSFFVPDKSADKPAAKSMASTVAGANARFSEVVQGQTRKNRKGADVPATKQLRKFKIFEGERTMPDGSVQKGARIFRVAVDAEAANA